MPGDKGNVGAGRRSQRSLWSDYGTLREWNKAGLIGRLSFIF